MAVATVTSNSYGYRATGGTDATTISANKINIKSLLFFPATGANSCTLTDYAGNAFMTIKGNATAAYETQIWVDGRVDGLKATLTGTGDVLLVFIE
jgi:hypothetical protein